MPKKVKSKSQPKPSKKNVLGNAVKVSNTSKSYSSGGKQSDKSIVQKRKQPKKGLFGG